MSANINAINIWSDAWTTLIFAVLWQSTALALVVWAIAFALRRGSPTVRYWLWQIVAIKLLFMPLWSWSLALPWLAKGPADVPRSIVLQVADSLPSDLPPVSVARSVPGESHNSAHASISETSTAWHGRLSWQSWLFMGWATVVLFQVVKLSSQRLRLSRILRRATPAETDLAAAALHVAERLQIRRAPNVLPTSLDCSPFVCGILRPTLVLSQGVLELLSAEEMKQVLTHEPAHVKRRDLVWGWLPQLAAMLYFFHPLAHLAAAARILKPRAGLRSTGHGAQQPNSGRVRRNAGARCQLGVASHDSSLGCRRRPGWAIRRSATTGREMTYDEIT